MAMVTVRFKVNESNEDEPGQGLRAAVGDGLDPCRTGALPPIVELHSIDDVPFLTPHALEPRAGRATALRPLAAELAQELSEVPEASRAQLIGGQPRVVRVEPDPDRMAAAGVSWTAADRRAAGGLGARRRPARAVRDNREIRVEVGPALPQLRGGGPRRRGPARRAGPSTCRRSRASSTGPTRRRTPSSSRRARRRSGEGRRAGSEHPAVTIALAKRHGGERHRRSPSASCTSSRSCGRACSPPTSTSRSPATTARPPGRSRTSWSSTC